METYIVDSFTDEAFKGNPAGVCFPQQEISDDKMLAIARELGLSETAFVKLSAENDSYRIRYFSPKQEIPLCGHATLASAKVLFKKTGVKNVLFVTAENVHLPVTETDGEITMTFPIYETVDIEVPQAVLDALQIKTVNNKAYNKQNKIILLEIDAAAHLAALSPDFNALVNSYTGINGVLVTAKSNKAGYDYDYRYFWPWAGTNEDPVTGGVQTFLAKYWSVRLNKTRMKAFQSSSRTGYMYIELKDDSVLIKSQAIIVLEGNLCI